MGRLVTILTLASALLANPAADPAYRAGIEKWRQQREARLKAEDGWLAVAGLFWLEEGANRFGSGSDNAIVLPAGRRTLLAIDSGAVTPSSPRANPTTCLVAEASHSRAWVRPSSSVMILHSA